VPRGVKVQALSSVPSIILRGYNGKVVALFFILAKERLKKVSQKRQNQRQTWVLSVSSTTERLMFNLSLIL